MLYTQLFVLYSGTEEANLVSEDVHAPGPGPRSRSRSPDRREASQQERIT